MWRRKLLPLLTLRTSTLIIVVVDLPAKSSVLARVGAAWIIDTLAMPAGVTLLAYTSETSGQLL